MPSRNDERHSCLSQQFFRSALVKSTGVLTANLLDATWKNIAPLKKGANGLSYFVITIGPGVACVSQIVENFRLELVRQSIRRRSATQALFSVALLDFSEERLNVCPSAAHDRRLMVSEVSRCTILFVEAIVVVVILVVLLLVVLVAGVIRRRAAAIRAADVNGELRLQMLRATPQDLGLEVSPGEPYAIVMDIAYPQAVASLVAALSGDASIYFSTGGGVIGGGQHESVRVAAMSLLREAAKHLAQLATASDGSSYPAAGTVRFYVSTPEGRRFAEVSEQELQEGQHPLSPLYMAGQNVITALRTVTGTREESAG